MLQLPACKLSKCTTLDNEIESEDDSDIPAYDLLSSPVTPSHIVDSIKLPPIDKKQIHQDIVSDDVDVRGRLGRKTGVRCSELGQRRSTGKRRRVTG